MSFGPASCVTRCHAAILCVTAPAECIRCVPARLIPTPFARSIADDRAVCAPRLVACKCEIRVACEAAALAVGELPLARAKTTVPRRHDGLRAVLPRCSAFFFAGLTVFRGPIRGRAGFSAVHGGLCHKESLGAVAGALAPSARAFLRLGAQACFVVRIASPTSLVAGSSLRFVAALAEGVRCVPARFLATPFADHVSAQGAVLARWLACAANHVVRVAGQATGLAVREFLRARTDVASFGRRGLRTVVRRIDALVLPCLAATNGPILLWELGHTRRHA